MSPPLRSPVARVLLTTDAVGGVWTYSLDLASGLSRAGLAVELVVLGPSPSADQLADAAAIANLSLTDTGLPLDWMAREPAEIRQAGAAIRELARDRRVDLVHLNGPALAAGGGFAAPVVGACHSCLATWWSAVKDGPMPDDFRWRTQALGEGLLGCDTLLAPTHAFAEAVRRAYDLPAPQVVWNGRQARMEADARPREAMVLASGRLWDEGKNVAVLDAAAGLTASPLYAAGPLEGPAGGALRLRHAQALGRLSAGDMAAWLRRAPVYASAALYEPFGLGVLEAAQAGCALVLSDIPTLRELWDGAAVFVRPDDPQGYARAFDRLLADEAARAALAAEARARAARYSVARMCAGVLTLYRRLQPSLAGATIPELAA